MYFYIDWLMDNYVDLVIDWLADRLFGRLIDL